MKSVLVCVCVLLGLVASTPLPAAVVPEQIRSDASALAPIVRTADLPPAVQKKLLMADPGKPWNATDSIIDPTLPGRRLIVAGCDARLCVVHYERGGIAFSYRILAMRLYGDAWTPVWSVYGTKSLGNFAGLRAYLAGTASAVFWPAGDDY